jgi:hypothetical protein
MLYVTLMFFLCPPKIDVAFKFTVEFMLNP